MSMPNSGYHLLVIFFFMVFTLTSCRQKQEKEVNVNNPSMPYWSAIAKQIVRQAQLQREEKVLLVAEPGRFDPLVPLLKEQILNAGAIYLGAVSITGQQPEPWRTEFTAAVAVRSKDQLRDFLRTVDLGIMLPGATPADKVYAALQEVLKGGSGRTIHFHWAGAYRLDGVLFPPDEKVDACYESVLLKTDYDQLASKQKEFENAMRKGWIYVTTPEGTDLRFQIGSRQVTKQNGNASLATMEGAQTLIDREVELPAGAIRVAPIEESVAGVIAFPDADWNGQRVAGLRMTFEAGKVVAINAVKNLEAVQQEIERAGEAARSFREFALGFNPLLEIPAKDPWIPYYGYGAGMVRLSLGDNTELGGKVTGGYVRWNFFTNATVKIDDITWVENGKLIR